MRNIVKTLFVAGLASAAAGPVVAQEIDLGVNLGLSGYEGDLSAVTLVDRVGELRSSFGAYGRVAVMEGLAVRAYVQRSEIRGDDAIRPTSVTRNLSFTSKVFELGVSGEYYPFRMSLPVQPYVSLGVSVYNFNPEVDYNGRLVELQPLGTEGQGMPGFAPRYKLTRMAVPVGVGFTRSLGRSFVVGAEFNMRALFFDHLDDVSGDYVNYFTLADGEGVEGSTGNGPLAAALADRTAELTGGEPRDLPTGRPRGNPAHDDWFYTGTITIGYRIGSGMFSGAGYRDYRRYNRCYTF